jgi:hypothetical protein
MKNALKLASVLIVATLAVWGMICIAVPAKASDRGTWRDMPPGRYQGTVTVNVSYAERPLLQEWCGRQSVACYHTRLRIIFMPVQCSPMGRPMAQRETINVADLVRNDTSYCGSIKAHEGGHALGWSFSHEH